MVDLSGELPSASRMSQDMAPNVRTYPYVVMSASGSATRSGIPWRG